MLLETCAFERRQTLTRDLEPFLKTLIRIIVSTKSTIMEFSLQKEKVILQKYVVVYQEEAEEDSE